MLSSSQLDSIRKTVETGLTDQAYIKRQVFVSDGKGGRTSTVTTYGPYAARLRTISHLVDTEQLNAGRLTGEARYSVSFEALTDVRKTDQITVSGITLEVVNVLGPTTREATRRAQCIEVS
ncbi:MAG: hypothetical protein M3P51_15575 [Chloroflexota bacterium]|nr:hypothetical protein [Chloroflexota bacterium]